MILLVLVAAVLVFHGLSLGLAPQDDAFISFRYAENLLRGNGLVFNSGERVEGYTNFLWTVSMAPVLATGVDPVRGARTLGMACAIGLFWLLWRHARREDGEGGGGYAGIENANARIGNGLAGIGASFLLASSSSYVAEAIGGLETILFSALVTALVLRTEREERSGGSGVVPGLLGALAALTRPEGSLVAIGAAVHRLLPAPFGPVGASPDALGRGAQARAAARTIAIAAGVALVHRLCAWGWYGQPLPNTFYAKVGGTWDSLVRGAAYAGGFGIAWLPVLVLAAIGLTTLPGARRTLRGVFIAGYVLYVIGVGGDYKWTLRFFAPVLPLVCLLAARGIGLLASIAERPAARRVLAAGLAAGAAAGTFALSGQAREFSTIRVWKYATDRLAGEWFARHAPPGSLLATSNAGIIPYYAGLPTIDMLGLTDAHISHVVMPRMGAGTAGHEKGDGAYVYARKPDYVLFMQTRVSENGPVPLAEAIARMNFVAELQLWQNPDFQREYEWVSEPLSGYTLNFFRRRSSPSS